MLIVVQLHDFFFSSFLNKYEFFKNITILFKFSVSSLKMIIISNHNQFFFLHFYVFLYNKLHFEQGIFLIKLSTLHPSDH
jgi:hypothetical protein